MIGETIKHYQIEELLGKGGMGVVYRARDTRLGRPVALKVLPPEFTRDEPERKARFLREARAASAVNHPAIAQIYDVDEGERGLFIAMELVEGRTVQALVQARELDALGAIEIAHQVAGGLQKAHEAGIVHRDIKPENVIVTPGRARQDPRLRPGQAASSPTRRRQDGISQMETLAKTQAGFVLGTLRYMSPEQARGQAVDHRSDIFSLGVLLYEMVTGQLPFSGNTAARHAARDRVRGDAAGHGAAPEPAALAAARDHALPAQARRRTATPTPGSWRATSRPCSARSRAASRARPPLALQAPGALAVAARPHARRVAAARRA